MVRHCITDDDILASGPTTRAVIEQVEKALTSARFAAQAQPHVLALVKALFLRLRLRSAVGEPAAATLLSKMLVLVGKQREDSRFEWKKEADAVLDSAIKVLGPATVLRFLPLGLSAENANPAKARAWLLPLLKPAVTNTRLAHFRETFVPLSAGFFNKAEEAKAANRAMEGKVWETLVGQVWALLPGYCEYPTDLVTAFDTDFVSLVANVVYTQASLRPSIFKALSTLLATTLALANSTSPPDLLREQFGLTPADGQASLAHLQSLAQTVLSVAFNVYGKMARGEGGYVLEAVAAWVAILPADELAGTYERVSGLAAQALDAAALTPHQHGASKDDPTLPAAHALLDILVTLVPQARGPTARALFDFALSDKVVASADAAVQKKGYRILARLCEETKSEVLKGREGEVIDAIVEGAGKVANGAKRVRFRPAPSLPPPPPPPSVSSSSAFNLRVRGPDERVSRAGPCLAPRRARPPHPRRLAPHRPLPHPRGRARHQGVEWRHARGGLQPPRLDGPEDGGGRAHQAPPHQGHGGLDGGRGRRQRGGVRHDAQCRPRREQPAHDRGVYRRARSPRLGVPLCVLAVSPRPTLLFALPPPERLSSVPQLEQQLILSPCSQPRSTTRTSPSSSTPSSSSSRRRTARSSRPASASSRSPSSRSSRRSSRRRSRSSCRRSSTGRTSTRTTSRSRSATSSSA